MKCNRELVQKIDYCSLKSAPPMLCLDIVVHNPKNKTSVADTAEVDTGFDYGILLTDELVELLKISFDDSERIVIPDKKVITCGVAEIWIKIGEKWFKMKAHHSKLLLTTNPILGRGLLNKLNLCLRGENENLFIT